MRTTGWKQRLSAVALSGLCLALSIGVSGQGTDAADAQTGSLKGQITIDGDFKPLDPVVKKGAPVQNAGICSAKDLPNEAVVVDPATKGIANVFVYLQKAPDGYKAPPVPKDAVVFDQKDCKFFPHGLVLRVDQELRVLNDDDCLHNTHVISTTFEKNEAIKAKDRTGIAFKYPKPQKYPVKVVCDLHAWMVAYQLPLDHPFGAVTNEKGEFEIKDLPPGKYEFLIWQETSGVLERKYAVEIKGGQATDAKLKFPATKFKAK